jgi:signal transduction histidine kinase
VAVTASAELAAAFEELVENAIEHNDGPAPTAEITVEPGDEVVRVRVADDGPGIPETELEVLRDANAETPINHGQGLGLWLVYLTVQRSGGTIELTESTSDGSVVTIELPTADEEPVADATGPGTEQG